MMWGFYPRIVNGNDIFGRIVPVRRVELARERRVRTLELRRWRRNERYWRHHPLTPEERQEEHRAELMAKFNQGVVTLSDELVAWIAAHGPVESPSGWVGL